ncbi:MAG: cell envelope integrity protein TolA [Burkholderiaceae bacterium]
MSAVLARDPFMPRQPRGMGAGLALALLAHALLIVALAFGVNWRSHEPEGVEAELWSAVPQFEAPRAVAPPPAPAPLEPKRPEPVAKAPPVREPAPDPQIAIEQAKREKAKLEQTEREKAEREKAKRDKAAREEDERAQQRAEQAKKKQQADKDRAEADKLAAAREANLQRMLGQAGATGAATATGTAARTSGPSASYAGRIMARIKPNIVFTDPLDGNPIATVEVRLAPDGTIIGKRLVKSSGVKSWDDAVMRAIERTEILPRDTDGRVPGPFEIDFKRRD